MAPRRRERWYSIEGQRRNHETAMQSSHGPRRLISLVVLLVLTLIMIQQVSDPRRVARVAGAVGLLPGESSANPLTQSNAGLMASGVSGSGDASESSPSGIDFPWQATDRESTQDSADKPSGDQSAFENVALERVDGGPTAEQVQDLFLHHGDRSIQLQSEVLESLLQSSSSDLLFQLCRSEFGASATAMG
ncbi:MAG: hypothetical protein ACK52S_10390, partial [Pirellula sp.]